MSVMDLCKRYTELNDEDIRVIMEISTTLNATAELVGGDVFIDCLTRDRSKAVVVAEASPFSERSNYKEKVVGKFALQENEPAAIRTLNTGTVSRDFKAITQEKKIVVQNTAPIRNKKGKVIGVLIIEKSIEKDVLDNEQILSKPLFDKSFELIPETFKYINKNMDFITQDIDNSIVIFNKEGTAIYANKCAEDLYMRLGYSYDITGRNFEDLALDGSSFNNIISVNSTMTTEVVSEGRFLEIKYSVVIENQIVEGVNMIVVDITDRISKEKELMAKSVVIKEIHHRVKNNLQTIMSLLSLQSRRVDDIYLQKAFQESISRISSIAVTHELLASDGIDEVYILDILKKLSDNMLNYIERPNLLVSIDVLGDNFAIDSDKSTSIALVVNELIQNSIEHGFKNRDEGNIKIQVVKKDSKVTIIYKDNGSGFLLEDISEDSLGLNIIEQLVEGKLNGDLKIYSDPFGTEVNMVFKI